MRPCRSCRPDVVQFHLASLPAATAVWCSVYLSLRVAAKRNPEFTSRVVALLHATVAILVGGYLCLSGMAPEYSFDVNEPMAASHMTLFTISFGYFLYDLMFCLWQGKETKLMIMHHIYSVASLLRLLLRSTQGTSASCGLAAMELTNPLLQARWFIRTAGAGNSIYFYIVEATFIMVFIVVRGIFGTYVLVHVLLAPTVDIENKIQATLMHAISLAFIYNILKYIRSKYIKKMGKIGLTASITRVTTFSVVSPDAPPPPPASPDAPPPSPQP